MREKMLQKDNEIMTNRLYAIVSENREKRTREFCPGLRIGGGNKITLISFIYLVTISCSAGIVIDCYESACQPFFEYKMYMKQVHSALDEILC